MLDLKPIRTEADYEDALQETQRLWGQSAGTLEGDRLDILLILIEAYEKQHFAMDPPDPIDAILYRVDAGCMTCKDLESLSGNRG